MTTTQKVTESEIKLAYEGQEFAEDYIEKRFVNQAQILLHRMQVAAVTDMIGKIKPEAVLEVAPGPGRVTRDIHTSAKRVCLEFNQGMIEVGQAACDPAIDWQQGDAFDMPTTGHFETGFDLAFTYRFIRHFKTDDRNRVYEQFKRVIKPGGYLIFDAVNEKVSKPIRDAHPEGYPIYDVLYKNLDELKTEVEAAGFQLEKAIPVQRGFTTMMKCQNLVGPRANWLNKLLISAMQKFSPMAPLEWIAVCRRV
ncbi:MAG: hypothetical protein COA78_36845 [Blastopirellula sp.]|nr:MAG: hypothetical protein COA78_36845 [Blastopirellula sp.]